MSHPPRLWYSRGYLPHFDCPRSLQAVTFRLADSLPAKVIETLDRIVKSWKSYTARKINESEERSGAFWARDYHDRYIRDEKHLWDARLYVRNNPVKAGLCGTPEAWRFGSAWEGREHGGTAGRQAGTTRAGLRTGAPG